MGSTTQQRIVGGFAIGLVILVAGGLLTFATVHRLVKEAGVVRQSRELIATLEELHVAVSEAEAAKRGFLITGGPRFLERFDSGSTDFPRIARQLQQLVASKPEQLRRLGGLLSAVTNELHLARTVLAPVARDGSKPAQRVAREVEATRLEDEIDGMVSAMIQQERQTLAACESRTETGGVTPAMWIAVGGAVTAGLIGLSLMVLRRDYAQRTAAEARLREAQDRLEKQFSQRTLELEQINQTLRVSEERLRLLVEGAKDYAITMLDAEGRVVSWNPGAERIHGWAAAEATGQSFAAFYPVEEVSSGRPRRDLEQALREGRAELEGWRVRKDGSRFWASTSLATLRDAGGSVRGVVSVVCDHTERHQAQRALEESESRLGGIIHSMMDGIVAMDADLRITLVNPAAEHMFRCVASEVVGLPFDRLVPERLRVMVGGIISQFSLAQDNGMTSGNLSNFRGLRADGEEFVLEASISGGMAEGRRIYTAILRDVTARREAESQLRQSEERFRQVVENLSEVFWMREIEGGRLLYLSPSFETLWGLPCQSLYDAPNSWIDAVHPADRVRVLQASLVKQERGDYEEVYRIVRPDRADRWVRERAFPIRDSGGKVYRLAGVMEDITRSKRADEQMQLQSAALEAAADAIVIMDREGKVEWVNPAFTEATGYSIQEALGRNPFELLQSNQQEPGFNESLWSTLRGGTAWRGEVVSLRKDGSLFTGLTTITPLRANREEITHFIAIKQDISEKKRLEAQLLQTQRLESVGRLASGIAHDLNNILVPMMMSPDALRSGLTDPALLGLVDTIESGAKRGAAIIRQLLAFSRGAAGDRNPMYLGMVVEEMMKIVHETFPKNITPRLRLGSGIWPVNADATQLHQVLMNLCVNAKDAMPEGGTLVIALENKQLDEVFSHLSPGSKVGRYVVVTVGDTGKGIDPQFTDKIFDPFFTTKPAGQGTGLGLSTVLGIVKSHGGFIQLDSKPGVGTNFMVYLPACELPGDTLPRAELPALPQGRGELILLVDDEDGVRRVARRTLERYGYVVIEAADGAEGVMKFAAQRKEIAAVVTDIMMPHMDGQNFIRALRHSSTTTPIIAISGHLSETGLTGDAGKEVQAFLPKPFSAAVLLETLQRVLAPSERS